MESWIVGAFRCALLLYMVIPGEWVLFSYASSDSEGAPHRSGAPMNSDVGQGGGNCTAASMDDLPCTPDRCFLQGIPVSGAEVEPCLPAHHQDYLTDEFYQYTMPPPARDPLPMNTWLMFRNRLGECQDLIAYNASSELCPMTDYCGARYPWYLSASLEKVSKFGVSRQAQLCMTDNTSRGTAVCCRHSTNVTVRSCGFYNIYKIDKPLVAASRSSVCTARLREVSSRIEKRSTGLVKNKEYLTKRVDELTEEERMNLISVRFSTIRTSEINIWSVIDKYDSDIIGRLNSFYNSRAKRWTFGSLRTLSSSNVRHVTGTPIIENSHLYYTYYIQSDSGEILSEMIVKRVSKYLSNTEYTPLYAYINSSVTGLHPDIQYPEVITPTSDIPHTKSATQTTSTADWKYILYIICFTAAVLVVVLIALALYTCKLHHTVEGSNHRSRPLSKLDRVLLCNKRPLESSDHVIYQNGHSSSPIIISNTLSKTRTPIKQACSKTNGHAISEAQQLTDLNNQ